MVCAEKLLFFLFRAGTREVWESLDPEFCNCIRAMESCEDLRNPHPLNPFHLKIHLSIQQIFVQPLLCSKYCSRHRWEDMDTALLSGSQRNNTLIKQCVIVMGIMEQREK